MVSFDSVGNDYIENASFITYSNEDILKISVKQVTQPVTVTNLGVPVTGGLLDSSLGATELNNVCSTCHLKDRQCPGHFGHIQLSLPVFNPLFFKLLQNLLRGTCFFCHRPYIKNLVRKKFLVQYRLIREAKFVEYEELEGLISRWTRKMVKKVSKQYESQSNKSKGNKSKENESQENESQQYESSYELEDLILAKIDRFYQKTTSNSNSSTNKSLTSTIIARLDEHLKTFMNGTYLDNGSKCCNHCGLPKLKLQSEFSTVFILKPTRNDPKSVGKLNSVSEAFAEESSVKINDQTYSKNHYLTALDVKLHMSKVWTTDAAAAELLCTLMNRNDQSSYNKNHNENQSENRNKELKGITVVDSFFMDHILVVPPRYRPVSIFGDSKYENPMTILYVKIITTSYVLNEILHSMDGEAAPHEKIKLKTHVLGNRFQGKESFEKIQSAWTQLQTNVNALVDAELNRTSLKDKVAGIRQILEKKEGLFRMHMMGKRVNYAARSVITPDPYLDVDEVGLPEIFASKLTIPEPVTDANFHRLQSAVFNGPAIYPGANMIEKSSGHKIYLQAHRPTRRDALAKQLTKEFDDDKLHSAISNLNLNSNSNLNNFDDSTCYQYKKVYRHVVDGDIVLMNRQPTLHRPSIMAHRVRVLPKEKTIRMHYANCKSYNADFDGDEMNSHCPQTEMARSEAYNLVATSKHYLSPRDGKPLTGLIQDYMISGVILTMQDRFFTRDQYHQLVYAAFIDYPGRIKTVPPTIIKPNELWTGKNIVSTIMLNVTPHERKSINVNSTSKLTENLWNIIITDPILKEMTDNQVVIRDGELLVGILDKNQYGASPYGIIHSFFEVYGGCVGSKLLSVLGRLFISYLQIHGFTLGIEDTICVESAQLTRKSLIEQSKAKECGLEVLKKAFRLQNNQDMNDDQHSNDNLMNLYRKYHCRDNSEKLNEVEFAAKHFTNEFQNKINSACLPNGLMKTFPRNNLQLMIQSGAKGTSVNAMQISCLLGQIELEGKRPQMMSTGKTLPCFFAYDPSIASGGFTSSSFLSGLQPSEFFFHCMAGREGLVDTAVKTSRSGYLQRCLIKHMEGLAVNYDLSVRDSDGSIVQFLYGEDGCDTTKIQFAFDNRFDLISMNHHNFYDELNVDAAGKYLDSRKASKYFKSVEKSFKSYSRASTISNINSTSNATNVSNINANADYKIIGYHSDYNHKLLSGFQRYCKDIDTNFDVDNGYKNENENNENDKNNMSSANEKYRKWYELDEETKSEYNNASKGCPLPVLAFYTPTHYMGSVSEMYNDLSKGFIKKELFKKYSATVVNDPMGLKDISINSTNLNISNLSDLRDISDIRDIGDVEDIRWKCERKLFEKLTKLKYIKSLVDPGESVGILAGQSVGEPSTQMTLNTFHFAGRGEMNVTLGIPRLREILLVGSAKIKTPSVTVPVLSGNPQALLIAQQLEKKLTPIAYSTFLHQVVLTHNKLYDPTQKCLVRSFTLKFSFLNSKTLKRDYNVNRKHLMAFSERIFLKKLAVELNKTTKCKKNFFIVNEDKSAAAVASADTIKDSNDIIKDVKDDNMKDDMKDDIKDDDHKPNRGFDKNRLLSDDEDDDEDGDKHEDYGDNSEDIESNEEFSIDEDDNKQHPLTSTMVNHEDGTTIPSIENLLDSDNDDNQTVKCSIFSNNNDDKSQRIKHVMETYQFLSGYNFDDKHFKWFELSFELPANLSKTFMNPLIKRVTENVKYNYVVDIQRCFVKSTNNTNSCNGNKGDAVLTIEGDNIRELWKYGASLDFNRLYCNNIQKVASYYGIEAARVVLIKEIQNVFGAYGITVNYRHLSLVADYMTFRGVYNAFNRFSLTSCPSPFQKMSYETTMNFLRYACSYGQNDPIESPSARLVIGRPVHVGTDFFDVLTKLTATQPI